MAGVKDGIDRTKALGKDMVREQQARMDVMLKGGEAQARRAGANAAIGAVQQQAAPLFGGLEKLSRGIFNKGQEIARDIKNGGDNAPAKSKEAAKVEERSAAKPAEPKAEDSPKEKSWWDKVKSTVGDGVKAAEEFHEDNKRQQEERGKNDQPSDTGQGFQFGSDASVLKKPSELMADNKVALDPVAKVADTKLAAAPTGPAGMA